MKKVLFLFGFAIAMLGVSANTLNFASITKVENKKEDEKKVEIPATSLPDKISKGITDANKDSKIVKAFKVVDAKGAISGYEVVVLTNSKEETLKFDKNGDHAM
jgi:hypothetical protein